MKPTRTNTMRLGVLSLSLCILMGCTVNPYSSNYSQGHPSQGRGGYGPVEQVARTIDLTGEWALSTGGINRFSRTHDGYYVAPRGGRAVHYVEIGENLYQDANGPGTYEVVDAHTLIWFSNNNRNRQITLYRQ